jgi:hypothetical protein
VEKILKVTQRYVTPILNSTLIIPKLKMSNPIVYQCFEPPLPWVSFPSLHGVVNVVLRAHMLHGANRDSV